MLGIAIDNAPLDEMIDALGATDKEAEAARTSTLRKIRKRIETRVKRQAAKKLRIPQRAIGDRFFSNRIEPGDDVLKLWIGTWNLSPFSIGMPTAYGVPGKSGGVRVGRRTYPGAFLGRIYSGQTKVWIRLGSKHFSRDLYPTRYRPGDRFGDPSLRGRFPVVRAAVPIDGVIEEVLDQEGDAIAADFERVFFQELNYQVNVKGDL